MFPQNKNGVLIGPVLSLCFVWVKVHVNNIHDIDMLCGAQASGVGVLVYFLPCNLGPPQWGWLIYCGRRILPTEQKVGFNYA